MSKQISITLKGQNANKFFATLKVDKSRTLEEALEGISKGNLYNMIIQMWNNKHAQDGKESD
jgi:hypothetical protein